jgi:hypothetical protein
MEDVTHKQIYDRLIEVEKKVDDIDRHTLAMVGIETLEANNAALEARITAIENGA